MTNKTKINMFEDALRKLKFLPWLICGLGAAFYSYEYLLRVVPSVMTADLMLHFNINASLYGGTTAFYYYAYVPMQLPVGIMMDRFGPRRLLTFACLSCVIGSYVFIATHSVFVAAFGRFLVGFGSAFAFVGALKLATIWLPPERLAFFAGLVAALGTLGAVFGDVVLTTLVSHAGYKSTIYYAASIGIILSVVIWAVVRNKNYEANRLQRKSQANTDIKQVLGDLVVILSNPQIWINGLIGCLIYLPTTVFAELWAIPYLKSAYYFSATQAAYAVAALFFGFTIGAPLNGWFSARVGHKIPLFFGSLGAMLIICLIIYAPVFSKLQVTMLLFLMGLMYSSQVIVFAIGRDLSPPEAAGTAIAVTNMLVMSGGMLFQPLVGILLDWRASDLASAEHVYFAADYKVALFIIPIGLLGSAILTLFLKDAHDKGKRRSIL